MKLRSLLFVPGDSARKLSKSVTVPADALILDLEDSVAPENKAAARKLTGDFLAEHAEGRQKQIWVRINPLDQPAALEDLAAIMHGRPDGIVQPKSWILQLVRPEYCRCPPKPLQPFFHSESTCAATSDLPG